MLVAYAVLGVIAGLVSALFIYSIYGFEHFFENRVKGGYYVQHAAGMLTVGLMLYCFMRFSGHYYVEGVGYATIQDVLASVQFPLYFLVLLFVAKLLATSLTLGSGASGGVFSPALFLGATAGGAYGVVLHRLFPALDISAPAFAVVGMGGVVGGATGAAMAAIVMIFEMTLDYTVIIPMTLTVAISYGVRKKRDQRQHLHAQAGSAGESGSRVAASRSSIHPPRGEHHEFASWKILPGSNTSTRSSVQQEMRLSSSQTSLAPWTGVVTGENLAALDHAKSNAHDRRCLCRRNYVVVSPGDSLWDVVAAMRSTEFRHSRSSRRTREICRPLRCKGMISRKDIMDTLARNMELFGV